MEFVEEEEAEGREGVESVEEGVVVEGNGVEQREESILKEEEEEEAEEVNSEDFEGMD